MVRGSMPPLGETLSPDRSGVGRLGRPTEGRPTEGRLTEGKPIEGNDGPLLALSAGLGAGGFF